MPDLGSLLNQETEVIHKFDDVNLGELSSKNVWSREDFLDYLVPETPDYTLVFRANSDTMVDWAIYHKNFLKYLEMCWRNHLGVVVTPDIVWHMLLCEVAGLIKNNPDLYGPLFSTSKEKQRIEVVTPNLIVMPLDQLVGELEKRVPSDTSSFFPEFTTTTCRSSNAFRAAFCDAVSPYYNYYMLLCGFPYIDIRGSKEDWCNLTEHWKAVSKLIGQTDWTYQVQNTLNNILINLDSKPFWNTMFTLQKCGSGSQVVVSGWIRSLYREIPQLAYPDNFSSHVSIIEYTQLDSNKTYMMHSGLLSSFMENEFLVPDYGYVVHEKLEASIEKK
jgi:hypothetical protein